MPRSTSLTVRRFSTTVGVGTGSLVGSVGWVGSVGSDGSVGVGLVDERPSVYEPVGAGPAASFPPPRLATNTPAPAINATTRAIAPGSSHRFPLRPGGTP